MEGSKIRYLDNTSSLGSISQKALSFLIFKAVYLFLMSITLADEWIHIV
jgi:hypothetical protein